MDDRERRVRMIFDEVIERPESDRQEHLRRLCGSDETLRADVDALLEHDRDPIGFIDTPPPRLDENDPAVTPHDPVPTRITIAGYSIHRRLGSGGSGTVFEARQASTGQSVAVKLLRPGVVSPPALRRFRHEAEILARLNAPGIARIYDAGTVEMPHGAQPYLVMELVDGVPLTRFARDRALSLRDRLTLFGRVCDAVHEAHVRGIIHRDLKPANVLVRESGEPVIVDFGLARIVEGDREDWTHQTRVGEILGTLPYMSPEQASLQSSDVDTRSDVYALGVVLYELLAGRLPDPREPQTVEGALEAVRSPRIRPIGAVDRAMRGDVETIVAKALEPDRARRYQSALHLAADIRRHLADEPISARPPSLSYHVGKFARRHRGVVGAGLAGLVLVVGSAIATSVGLIQARRGESDAEAALGFLVQLIQSARPEEFGSRVLVTDLLSASAVTIPAEFGDQPRIESRLRFAIGSTYAVLGEYEEAERHLRAGLDIIERTRGADHPDAIRPTIELGFVLIDAGRLEEAEAVLRAAIDRARHELGDRDPVTLIGLDHLGVARHNQGRFVEAARIHEQVLQTRRDTLGPDHTATVLSMERLANTHLELGRRDEAITLMRRVAETRRRNDGPLHPRTITADYHLSLALGQSLPEAIRLLEDAIVRGEQVWGPSHPRLGNMLLSLGTIYDNTGRIEEAIPILERAERLYVEQLGKGHRLSLRVTNGVACAYIDVGRLGEAHELLEQVQTGARAAFGPNHYNTLALLNNLAGLQVRRGLPAEAEPMYVDGIARFVETFGEVDPLHFTLLKGYGRCLLELGRPREAEPALLLAHEGLSALLPANHTHLRDVRGSLVELYDGIGQPSEADAFWRLLDEGH